MRLLIYLLTFISLSSTTLAEYYLIKLPQNSNNVLDNFKVEYDRIFSFNDSQILDFNKKSIEALSNLKRYVIADLTQEQYSTLKDIPNLKITPNYQFSVEQLELPNDPFLANQWNLNDVRAIDSWNIATGKGIKIGVIDTGIDFEHEDLKNSLWVNQNEDFNQNGTFEPWSSDEEVNGVFGDLNGIDDDGNGYIDDIIGYDFVDQYPYTIGDALDLDPIPFDENTHGTKMSGIIAATNNNNIGHSGIAFDSKLVTLRAFDVSGNAESDDIAKAVVYAALNGVDILNFSFGENYYSPIVHDAIKFADALGVVMVASTGNNNWYLEHYPSDLPEVISVGGNAEDGDRYSRSNYGNRIDLVAPSSLVPVLDVNNSYSVASGTSVAVPHVSSALALLKEKFPNLTPQELRWKILKNTDDINEERGWDLYFGNGRLNIFKALNSFELSELKVTYPEFEKSINLDSLNRIPVVGTIKYPNLRSYEIFIRKGRNPFSEQNFRSNEEVTEWISVGGMYYDMVENDTITFIPTEIIQDTIYTLRLKFNLLNNTSTEIRTYFRAYNDNITSGLKFFSGLKSTEVLVGEKTGILFTTETNFPALFKVDIVNAKEEIISSKTELDRSDLSHSILFTDEIPTNSNYRARAFAISGKDTIESTIFTEKILESVPNSSFRNVNLSLPPSFLKNKVIEIENELYVGFNQLQGLNFTNSYIYRYSNNEFIPYDSINSPRLIMDYGDTDNDDSPEILTTVNGRIFLYEYENNSFFDNTILETSNGIYWGTELFDIDRDGADEIIARDDSSYFIMKEIEGEYQVISRVTIPQNIRFFDNRISSETGDFDNDGNYEILFTNSVGLIFIYEYLDGELVEEKIFTENISTSPQYLTQNDFDGDGINEIAILSAGSKIPFGTINGKELIWTLRIVDFDDDYNIRFTRSFHGVKFGTVNQFISSYKNGLSSGDVNNDGKADIIVSVFPDLYIFSHNDNSYSSIWWYPNSVANQALVYDFNNNGINELGFNTFNGTRFFEFTENERIVTAPANFRGRPVDESTVLLRWESNDSDEYLIYNLINPNTGEGQLYARTQSDSVLIDTLTNNKWYNFFILAVKNDVQSNTSSNLVSCYTHPKTSINHIDFINSRNVILKYSNKIDLNLDDPSLFRFEGVEEIYQPNSLIANSDSTVNLFFENNIQNGDYIIYASPIEDIYRAYTKNDTIEANFLIKDDENYFFIKSFSIENNSIEIIFSENIDNTSENLNNYEISPFGEIANVEKIDENSVNVTLDKSITENALGRSFVLKLSNIKDVNGNFITPGPGSFIEFSIFKEKLSDVYIFPQPARLSTDESVTFGNLTSRATIQIFNENGEVIKEIFELDGNGGEQWDLRDNKGNKVSPGVYYYKITGNNGQVEYKSELKKFMITM